MRFKTLTISVVVASVLALATPTSATGTSGFGDVADDAFYADAVAWMVANGVTSGVEPGCFGPTENVSRGQVAAFLFRLDRALGNDPVSSPHPFDDVPLDYQQEPVGWLAAAGITLGTSPTTFEPSAPMTRGDFATMLWRYAGRPGDSPMHGFTDVMLEYQQVPVSWMAANGITAGTSATTFSPDGFVSRGEVATFLFRFSAPPSINPPIESSDCSRTMRAALTAGGLTADEAACAAPHLLAFTVDYLVSVVEGKASPSTALLDAAVAVANTGCLTEDRIAELIQRYF